jgi:hypothetical protein
MFIATAALIVAADQANSFSRGTMRTLGVARTPAPTSSIKKVTPATDHA